MHGEENQQGGQTHQFYAGDRFSAQNVDPWMERHLCDVTSSVRFKYKNRLMDCERRRLSTINLRVLKRLTPTTNKAGEIFLFQKPALSRLPYKAVDYSIQRSADDIFVHFRGARSWREQTSLKPTVGGCSHSSHPSLADIFCIKRGIGVVLPWLGIQ